MKIKFFFITYKIKFIILSVLLSFYCIKNNLKGQISNIIQSDCSDCLPSEAPDVWINAGCDVLNNGNGVYIKECIDVAEPGYGIIADGATDNSVALNTIINSTGQSGYTIIYFPAGAYYFSGTITLNKKFVILKGAGGANAPNQTHFHFNLPEGTGTCINIIGNHIGIEDVYFIQDELSSSEHEEKYNTNTITINGSNCWVRGVESVRTRRFHIGIYGNNNTISGCYLHSAENYSDDGGRGYGVCLSGNAYNNLIENNIFSHLRHSIVLQYYAKLNVLGYNYSRDPHGFNGGYDGTLNYSEHLADLCFHGHGTPGPTGNLCDGNYVERIRLDAYVHDGDYNGRNNTFFRNVAIGSPLSVYKPFSIAHVNKKNEKKEQYRQNIVGCSARPSIKTWNKINSKGYYAYWYQKVTPFPSLTPYLIPEWTAIPYDQYSYYKTKKPAFWYDWINWPYYPDNSDNPAKYRYDNESCKIIPAGWNLYENMCSPCIFDTGIDITETPALQHDFTATEYITASYAIPDAEPVTFAAGQYIELNPGFETHENGTFEAYIDPTISCDFCNKMLLGDYYPGAQDYSPKQKPEKEKIKENKNNTVFECRPNPFNNSTQIIFSIEETTNVRLYITSIYGIEVLELVNNELAKGIHNINIRGSALSSGIYYCILETKDIRKHIKLVKL